MVFNSKIYGQLSETIKSNLEKGPIHFFIFVLVLVGLMADLVANLEADRLVLA